MSQRRTNLRLKGVVSYMPTTPYIKSTQSPINLNNSSSRQVPPSILLLEQKNKRMYNKMSYSQSKVRSSSRKSNI